MKDKKGNARYVTKSTKKPGMLFFLLVLHFSTLLIILLVRPILHLLIIIYKRISFETNETFFPISILHTMPFRQPSANLYSRSSFSATPLIPALRLFIFHLLPEKTKISFCKLIQYTGNRSAGRIITEGM